MGTWGRGRAGCCPSFCFTPESRIRPGQEELGSKTRLSCTLNDSAAEVIGHRWVKAGKVLKEDALPGQSMEYE